MEAGTRLLPPPHSPNQTRTHLRNSSSNSVATSHDQAIRTVSFVPAASIVSPFAVRIISKDQQDDCIARCFMNREKSTEATLDKQQADAGSSHSREEKKYDFDHYQRNFDCFIIQACVICKRIWARHFCFDYDRSTRETPIEEKVTVRSKRLLERQSKKRRVPKNLISSVYRGTTLEAETSKKTDESLDSRNPLRLFLRHPDTQRRLTVKEEKYLLAQIQDLKRLEEVRHKLQIRFDHKPTLAKWAQAVGVSCQVLVSRLCSGRRSWNKMILANIRLVVDVAAWHQGDGLHFQDLLQAGSKGLIYSLGKFDLSFGWRFGTYAYWWIRQEISQAIYKNSQPLRFPIYFFVLLKRIKKATKLCIQEGCLPTNEEIAKRVGIKVKKLEELREVEVLLDPLFWVFGIYEIPEDPEVEPGRIFMRKYMKQHLLSLLQRLRPRDREVIEHRFGLHDNQEKTLEEIGNIYGVSKERIRQLESRAMNQLREFIPSEGLDGYIPLLNPDPVLVTIHFRGRAFMFPLL